MKRKHKYADQICDNCQCAIWQDIWWNRTLDNLPITLRCPHYHNGQIGIVRGSQACELFKLKTNIINP